MSILEKLIIGMSVPLFILNTLGGIISGIWLGFLGEWSVIGYGILALFVSTLVIGLALAPGILFATPAVIMLEKGNKFGGAFFGFLSVLYTYVILSAWSIFVLYFFTKGANSDSAIPMLIWSYGIATTPIVSMAQKDNNEHALFTSFFVQLAYIVVMGAILLTYVSMIDVVMLFGFVMAIGLLIQVTVSYIISRPSLS